MNCKNCGAPLREGAKFCQSCGTAVSQDKEVNTNTEVKSVDNVTESTTDTTNNVVTQEPSNVVALTPDVNQVLQAPVMNQVNPNMGFNQVPQYNQQMYYQPVPPKKNLTALWIALGVVGGLLLLGVAIIFICVAVYSSNASDTEYNTNEPTVNENGDKVYRVGQKFEFDDLEITVNDDYKFTVVDNKYSDYYNEPVVKIPVRIKNIGSENKKLNMFYFSLESPDGDDLHNVATLFTLANSDSADYANYLKPGESYDKYLYFIYDGSGTYTLEFDNWSTTVEVKLNIKK